ncbi:MAG: calcium/sodium antiporter [Rikenellaceae bacterium]
MDIVELIFGLALVLVGANYLTDGAAIIAKRLKISEFIVALTIVAIGTSAPEMVVSILSAIEGNTAISIGNVVGSNIFNVYVVLGICALIKPVEFSKRNISRDIPIGIVASVVLVAVTCGGEISRSSGVVMLALYVGSILYSIYSSRGVAVQSEEPLAQESSTVKNSIWLAIVMVAGGLAALVFGGDMFLGAAIRVATKLGVAQNVIAITLVAGGTSLPELAASLVSLAKGKKDIALGNIVGSNIANILLVLGASAAITPLQLGSITMVDIAVAAVGMALLWLSSFTNKRYKLDRAEGVIFLVIFGIYIWMLVRG